MEALQKQGFVLHSQGVTVSAAAWEDINEQAKRCAPIFNHNNKHKNDFKRRQWRLQTRRHPATQALIHELRTKVLPLYTKLGTVHTMKDTVILESLPGCQQQAFHTDYSLADLATVPQVDDMPLGVIIALEDNTKLMVQGLAPLNKNLALRTRKKMGFAVNARKGDVLIFRGDLIHAGAAYTQRNIRLHCYIDSQWVTRQTNATYPTSRSWQS